MHKTVTSFIAVAVLFLIASENASADKRSYVWTYEYMTMLPGRFELETYVTAQIPEISKTGTNTIKPQLELEYGITRNWDISLYQTWKYTSTETSHTNKYDGFKVRTRYKIGRKDTFIVDPLLYLEYIRNNDGKPDQLEGKAIIARDIGYLNVSYNHILKANLDSDMKTVNEYALGTRYLLSPRIGLGLESKGSYSEDKYAAGPTFAYFGKGYFISIGILAGLNDKTDDSQTRMIVGILL